MIVDGTDNFRPATCSTTRRSGTACTSSTARSTASRARRRSSPRRLCNRPLLGRLRLGPLLSLSLSVRRRRARAELRRGQVLGVLPGVIGSIRSAEALKVVLGIGEPLIGRLLLYDALAGSFDEVAVQSGPGLPRLRGLADDHRVRGLRRVSVVIPAELRRELEQHALEEAPNGLAGSSSSGRAAPSATGGDGTPTPRHAASGSRSSRSLVPRGRGVRAHGLPLSSVVTTEALTCRSRAERALGLAPWLILRTDTRELAAWRLDNGQAEPMRLA